MPLWAQNIFGDRGLVTSFSMNATKRWVKVRYMKRPAFTCHFDDKPALSVQCFATTCSKTCILLWLVKNLKQTAPTKKNKDSQHHAPRKNKSPDTTSFKQARKEQADFQ